MTNALGVIYACHLVFLSGFLGFNIGEFPFNLY
jgi:hypothetical protein